MLYCISRKLGEHSTIQMLVISSAAAELPLQDNRAVLGESGSLNIDRENNQLPQAPSAVDRLFLGPYYNHMIRDSENYYPCEILVGLSNEYGAYCVSYCRNVGMSEMITVESTISHQPTERRPVSSATIGGAGHMAVRRSSFECTFMISSQIAFSLAEKII